MNYERWGQSLGTDIMPAQPMLVQPPTSFVPSNTNQSTSTKTSSTPTGPTGPQLVAMLPSIIGAVAQGVAQGTQQPGTASNMPVQPDTGVPEMQCQDGYYRDPSSGICAPVSIAPSIAPTMQPGQAVPGTAMPVAAAQPSIVMPVLTFFGGCVVGAVAMHLYMRPKAVTSNRGRRPRRNRRRARR